MLRKFLPIAMAAGAILAPMGTPFAAAPVLKSVKVTLPESTRTFPGSGADAINNNCLACHSAGMVQNQPALTKAAWKAVVTKMINVYKAPVAPEDIDAIVDYLDRTKGAD